MRRARARHFVGRDGERARFAAMLDGSSEAVLLWIHGLGGVGKSALMAALRDDAEANQRKVIAIDARDLDPTPAALFGAMASSLGCSADAVPDELAAVPAVIMIDTYEQLIALDGWVRDDLIPSLPDRVLVVLAGREAPGPWRLEPGMSELVEVIGLRNLTPELSRELLGRRGVAADRQDALVAATHGHPLALALVADLGDDAGTGEFRLENAPDVVQTLVESLVRHVPSPEHRRAVLMCAEVFATTEDLLRALCGSAQAPSMFEWLAGLSFIDRGPSGLFPHDVARDALTADLRARDPATCRELHRIARQHVIATIDASGDRDARFQAALAMMYLHRASPIMRQVVDFRRLGTASPEPLSDVDRELAFGLLARRTGPTSIAITDGWYRLQPEAFTVYRSPDGELQAMAIVLELDRTLLDRGAAFDPMTAAARRHALEHGGLRDDDLICLGRTYVHRTGGLPGRVTQNDAQIRNASRWVSQPTLTWSYQVMHASTRWDAVLRYMVHPRVEASTHEIDGTPYALYAHDWRVMPRDQWLEVIGERELSDATHPAHFEVGRRAVALLALSEPEFRDAVRVALKDLMHDDVLARNPLCRSRAVRDAGEPGAATLRALIRQAVQSLAAYPRDEKLHRALHATYVDPAETQELAAERLDVPFSTYRRHLTTAIERVADWLWRREVGGT